MSASSPAPMPRGAWASPSGLRTMAGSGSRTSPASSCSSRRNARAWPSAWAAMRSTSGSTIERLKRGDPDMTAIRRLPIIAAALLLLALCRMPGAAAAEEQTFRAFSTFQVKGELMKTGVNDATYIGVLSGRFYIDTAQGPIDAGDMSCPVVVHINLKDSTQRGSGQCVLTGPKGNKAYMDLTCTGVPLVGCGGDSTITGGTGPLANI